MHQSQNVGRLDVVKVKDICAVIDARDLVGRASIHERLSLSVEAHVVVPEFEHHRLICREREGDELWSVARLFCLIHVDKARPEAHRPLRFDQEVGALSEPRLILAVIDSGIHGRRDDAAIEGSHVVSDGCHQTILARR